MTHLKGWEQTLAISAIMSAVTETDCWDNIWLSKQGAHNKIDAAVALAMAVGAATATDPGVSLDDWIKGMIFWATARLKAGALAAATLQSQPLERRTGVIVTRR